MVAPTTAAPKHIFHTSHNLTETNGTQKNEYTHYVHVIIWNDIRRFTAISDDSVHANPSRHMLARTLRR